MTAERRQLRCAGSWRMQPLPPQPPCSGVPLHVRTPGVALSTVASVDAGLGHDFAGVVDLVAHIAHVPGVRRWVIFRDQACANAVGR